MADPLVADLVAAVVDPAAGLLLQTGTQVDVTVGSPFENVLGSAVGAFLTTLVVGAIMLAVAEEYTEARMAQVLENPLGTFIYGLVCLVFVILVVVVLAITIVGLIVAVPFAILAWVIWAAGSAVGFLAVADHFVGHDDGWTTPLVVAAAANGLLALTGIGGLLSFAVGAAGFGAVLGDYLE